MCEENKIKCVHCGKEFDKETIKSYISIAYEDKEVIDFFCPFCSKILHGYTKVKERIEIMNCVICGEDFDKKGNKKTCSKIFSQKHKKKKRLEYKTYNKEDNKQE